MSRKPIIGKCRLCGEIKKLTFEHVPPETTFNNYSVRILSGEEVIKQVADPNNPPWDFQTLKAQFNKGGVADIIYVVTAILRQGNGMCRNIASLYT